MPSRDRVMSDEPSRVARWFEAFTREWIGLAGGAPHVVYHDAQPVPERPGIDYCDRCGVSFKQADENVRRACVLCERRRFPWRTLVRLGEFDGELRECIHRTKFQAWDAMGMELGRRLGRQVLHAGLEVDGIVPIPTPAFHRMRRGIDHTAIIARGVSKMLDRPVVRALHKASRPPQQTVATSARRANVRGSMSVRRWQSMAGYRVLLVDDVVTSGSTLKEACAQLSERQAPANIDVAVVAVAGGV